MARRYNSQSGNVLWFILLGIVLIGLLTAFLSRGSSSVNQSGNVEQMHVLAGQILRTAKAYETAIDQMKLRGGSESDISFENPDTTVDYTNANCTSSTCRIFDAGGAGLTYTAPPANAQSTASEWVFTGANNVGTTADPVGTTAAGTGNDLLIVMPNVTSALCTQINRLLELNEPDNDPPVDTTGISTAAFTGTYANSLTILDGDPTPFELDGESAGCFYDDAAGGYFFYQVILTR